MKKKFVTTVAAIVAALVVILVTNYTNSAEYHYRKDMKRAEQYYAKHEYEKSLSLFLSILEERDTKQASQGLVKNYIAMAKEFHETGDDEKAKENLCMALMFEPSNTTIQSYCSEWFPVLEHEVPARNMLEGIIHSDSRKLFSAFYPELMKQYVAVYEEAGLTEDDFYRQMDLKMEVYEGGAYIIKKSEPLNDVDLIAYEVAFFEECGFRVKVTDGYQLTIFAGYGNDAQEEVISVYRINQAWYVSHEYMGMQ